MRGAVRRGDALLAGLVVCGRCGRQMRVAYKPGSRYLCLALSQAWGEGQCLNLDGRCVERVVVDAFFAAIAAAELDLLNEVLAARRAPRDWVARQHADRVARAAYEVRLARRQYDAVDPDNRLVAGELERCWELALRAEVEAREAVAHSAAQPAQPDLDPALRSQLRDAGRRLPTLWAGGRLYAAHKKELLRALIRHVILARPRPDTIEVKVVWISGAFSVLEAHPPVHRTADVGGHERLTARVLALAAEGYPDPEIAPRLTAEGFRSARHPTGVPVPFVAKGGRPTARPRSATSSDAGPQGERRQAAERADHPGQRLVARDARRGGAERGSLARDVPGGAVPPPRPAAGQAEGRPGRGP